MITLFNWNCVTIVTVLFSLLDAAVVVAQTKHNCGKTKLAVRYVPAPIPKEYDKDKLIVRDIPEGVDEEYFITIIESKLGLDNEEDFSIDFRKTCAIIMFNEEHTEEGNIQ